MVPMLAGTSSVINKRIKASIQFTYSYRKCLLQLFHISFVYQYLFSILEFKTINELSSMGKIDQESLAVLELANRQFRKDLKVALILISNKKQTFNNLDNYETTKRILSEQNEIDNQQMMVSDLNF